MAFATGVATSIDDFLAQLVSFAVTNAGFTNEGSVTSSAGTGSRTVQRVSKSGVHWFFTRYANSMGLAAKMSYSALPNAANIDSPGGTFQSTYTDMNTWTFVGPFVGHYFFTEGTCVHAVLEVATGIFNHFSFGKVTPIGTWTGGWVGGEYVTGGSYRTVETVGGVVGYRDWINTFSHRPFNDGTDSQVNELSRIRVADTNNASNFSTLRGPQASPFHGMFSGLDDGGHYNHCSVYTRLLRDAHNETTNRTPIFPGVVRLRDSASGLYHLAATVPNVGILKMTPDMNPKDLINTDWQVFPFTMRTGGDRVIAALSYEYALAYRRIA